MDHPLDNLWGNQGCQEFKALEAHYKLWRDQDGGGWVVRWVLCQVQGHSELLAFNLGENIPKSKILRKVLRSLPERFHVKITAIKESKDIDKIPLTELVGNLQTYELGLTRIGKSSKSKSKSMALKAKSSDTDESSDDEDSKMKSYITRQFKKFMKNANAKGFDKNRKQSSSSQFKSQDKGKKDARDDS